MRRPCTTQLEATCLTWLSCWWCLGLTCAPVTTSAENLSTTPRPRLQHTPSSRSMKASPSSTALHSFYVHSFASLICFFSATDHPLSLQQLCRISVRMVLGTKASKVIGRLDISPRICSYLQYCDWLSYITGVMSSLGVCTHGRDCRSRVFLHSVQWFQWVYALEFKRHCWKHHRTLYECYYDYFRQRWQRNLHSVLK